MNTFKDPTIQKKASEKAKESPKHGKHGKHKRTLALEKALEKQAEDIVRELMIGRSKLMNQMTAKKLNAAKLRDIIDGVDKFTKNIQLLTGKETSKDGMTFTWIGQKPPEQSNTNNG